MNTLKRANLTKQAKKQYRKDNSPENTRAKIEQEQLITWKSPGGKTERQIDYIRISRKYRNTVRKAQTIPGWRANMAQQHKVIQMDICLKLMREYKQGESKETGKQIQYDLQALRKDTDKLTRWNKQGHGPQKYNQNKHLNKHGAK